MSMNTCINYSNQEFDYLKTSLASDNTQQDFLESEKTKETMSDVHTNATLVQTYIASCLTQKDIKLDKIKSIKKTQEDTREHARYWLDNLAPKINEIYTDVTGFCNLAGDEKGGFWKDLTALAHQLKDNNNENLSKFNEIIEVFQEDIEDRKDKTKELMSDLGDFKTDLETDNRNFQDIIADAQQIYSGSGGEIETLNSQIKALKTAIDKNIGIIAGGALATVIGIITIAVGAVGTVFTGGAAVKVIVAGVIATGTGIAMITVASKDLVEKQKEYGSALQNLAKIKGEMAALKNVEDHFTGLKDKNENAHTAVGNMQQGWTILHNNFKELGKSAQKIDPAKRNLLVNRLATTQKNFNSLNIQAHHMQKNSILKVEVSSEVMQYLGLAKTFYSFPAYSLCTKRLINPAPYIMDLREFAELVR